MNELHPYILEFEFDTSWLDNRDLTPFIKDLEKGDYNVVKEESISKKSYDMFDRIIKENFITGKTFTNSPLWVYTQNNKTKEHTFTHACAQSTIRGVVCLNPPKTGGEIQFSFHGGLYSIEPKVNTILIFPYWAFYRIHKQIDKSNTAYLTLDYFTESRSQIKSNKNIW